MIEEIRTYIKETVKIVNPKLRWDKQIFGADNNSSNAIDKEYKIVFGQVTPALIDTSFRADIPATVTIYRGTGVSDSEKDFNDMFCDGIEICGQAMKKERIPQKDSYIKNVIATASAPLPVEDNDNMIEVNIELNFEVYFNAI